VGVAGTLRTPLRERRQRGCTWERIRSVMVEELIHGGGFASVSPLPVASPPTPNEVPRPGQYDRSADPDAQRVDELIVIHGVH